MTERENELYHCLNILEHDIQRIYPYLRDKSDSQYVILGLDLDALEVEITNFIHQVFNKKGENNGEK